MEIDPGPIMAQATEAGHKINEAAVPNMVAQAIHGMIEQAIPGVQANGSVVIPELRVSNIIRPTGQIIT